MNKKSQFYILTAVVLIAITFGLFSSQKMIPKPENAFGLLVDNYLKEAPFAANSGNLEDFTLRFYDLAASKEPDFEMVSFYVSQDNVSVLSLAKPTIFINQHNVSFRQSIVFQRPDAAMVSIGQEQYSIDTATTGIKTIFLMSKEDSRNVRVE